MRTLTRMAVLGVLLAAALAASLLVRPAPVRDAGARLAVVVDPTGDVGTVGRGLDPVDPRPAPEPVSLGLPEAEERLSR